MKIHRLFACMCFFALATTHVSAQSDRPREASADADAAYTSGNFYDAIPLYKKAFSKESKKDKKSEIVFRTAECYRLIGDVPNEIVWYDKTIKAGYQDPIAIFYYADALKQSGKYDEAIVQYTNFKKASPSDPRGDIGIQSCQLSQKWKDKPKRYKVENLSPLNSKYSDFATCFGSKDHHTLVFSSTRQESTGSASDGITGEKFSDLFEVSVDKKGKWSSPKPLDPLINTEANEGAAAFDKKYNDIYFTRCILEKGKINLCAIYMTSKKGQTWNIPVSLNIGTGDSVNIGHPCFTADDQTMYFSGYLPGGFGGKDIWMSTYDKHKRAWGEPVNLGNKVNTAGDEMYPFLATDGYLYFASNGLPGMGGLDIFRTKMSGSTWDEPVNLQYPINSPYDDFAFIADTNNTHGYLTSNRDGGKGSDDIYEWNLPPLIFTLSGHVYDVDTKANIPGASIELFGSDGTTNAYKTDKTGAYKYTLSTDATYKVSATMKDYLNQFLEVSTKGLEQSKDFVGDFYLKSIARPFELKGILYDVSKWDLRPEAKLVLDTVVTVLNDNPDLVVEIGSHTDARPIPMTNDTLSQRRAQSVVSYLVEKGIDSARLVPKGYAEHQPRTIDADLASTSHFKQGDVMDMTYINKLKTKELKEEAHQLNRRTEFKVLSHGYVKGKAVDLSGQQDTSKISGGTKYATDTVAKKVDVVDKPHEEVVVVKEPGKIHRMGLHETYATVAKKYNITVKDLKTLNEIKTEQPHEGMELKVEPTGDYSDYDRKFYTLEKGDDSYSKIAKKLSLKVGDLKKMNKGVDEKFFKVGMRIKITEE